MDIIRHGSRITTTTTTITTGNGRFADRVPALKTLGHSAKKARQTVHRQSLLCRVFFSRALAKRFAKCQGALGKEKRPLWRRGDGDGFFAECQGRHSAKELTLSSVCPVALDKEPTREGPHVRFFAECSVRHSAKRASLPSASDITLGKVPKPVPRSLLFAECYTRQSDQYIPFLFVFCIPSTQTKDITYISQISSQT
jgi:hypothetical protein